jgi:hypothetical protein
VPKGADYVQVGWWVYSYAGKDGKVPLYSKQPKSWQAARFLLFLVGKLGKDPRVAAAARRQVPAKRTSPPKRGQGARRRAENRNAS